MYPVKNYIWKERKDRHRGQLAITTTVHLFCTQISVYSWSLSSMCLWVPFTRIFLNSDYYKSLSSKESACNAGDAISMSGSERSPGEGNSNPLQYSCLGNSTDRGGWWTTVHSVAKESDWTTNRNERLNNNKYDLQLIDSTDAKPWIWRDGIYGRLTIISYDRFSISLMSVPLILMLFKYQLYIFFPTHKMIVTPSRRKMTQKLIKLLHLVFVVQSLSHVWLFATPWATAHQDSLSFTISWSLLKLPSIESVMPFKHLILYCPLLLLLSIFPSIRVFSNELCIWWPEYWSFSFSICPSNEYSELVSFRTDWLDICAIQGTLKILLQHHHSKASLLWHSAFFMVQFSHPYINIGKTIALTRWTFVSKVMSLL